MRLSTLALAVATLLMVGSAHAALTLADDFNDGSSDNWTVRDGSISESGGTLSGSNMSLATLNGASGNTLGVDAIPGARISYVALVFGFASLSDNLFVKIQDNSGNGLFDRVFAYRGNNDQIHSYDIFDLAFEIDATLFSATVSGTSLSAFVEGTGQTFNFTLDGDFGASAVGLGFYGEAKADNFYVGGGNVIPEPGSLALLGLGLAGLGAWRRRSAR